MRKIAIVDDDKLWCLAVKRFFRNDFDVSIFLDTSSFLREAESYELALVDFYILPFTGLENSMTGSEVINYLKQTLNNPPILVLVTGFISKNDSGVLCKELGSAADAFFAKDAGLEALLEQTKMLITTQLGTSK